LSEEWRLPPCTHGKDPFLRFARLDGIAGVHAYAITTAINLGDPELDKLRKLSIQAKGSHLFFCSVHRPVDPGFDFVNFHSFRHGCMDLCVDVCFWYKR